MPRVKLALATGLAVMASGCATLNMSDDEIVLKRAQERYNYIMEPDFKAAYEYLSPGYREVNSYSKYLGTLGTSVKRVGAEVKSVSCEDSVCKVNVEVAYFYIPKGMQGKEGDTPITRVSEEKWVKVDGKWWFYKAAK